MKSSKTKEKIRFREVISPDDTLRLRNYDDASPEILEGPETPAYNKKVSQYELSSVLFADISGSTRLYEEVGDHIAKTLILASLGLAEAIFHSNGGKLVKRVGDGVLVTFRMPHDTLRPLRAALAAQRQVGRSSVSMAVGCHHGQVLFEDHDVFGDTVNVAAHLCKLACSGEVLTTRDTIKQLQTAEFGFRVLAESFRPKGRTRSIEVILLDNGDSFEETTDLSVGQELKLQETVIVYRDQIFCLKSTESRRLSLGRDPSCDVVVRNPHASRRHAVLFASGRHVMLRDQSTNGTYIVTGSAEPVLVLREDTHLQGSGEISLGIDPQRNIDELIQYRSISS